MSSVVEVGPAPSHAEEVRQRVEGVMASEQGESIPSGSNSQPPIPHISHEHQQRRQHKATYRRTHRTTLNATQTWTLKQESPSSSEDGLTLVPTALDGHRREVFGAYPIQISGTSLEALDEQLNVLTNEELVFEIRGGSNHPMLTTVFTAALQDVGLFSCYVAAAQSLYQQRRSPKGFRPSDQLVRLQQQGLSHIRDRLMRTGAETDDVLFASIVQLMVADSVCGNIQSLMSHQRGARKLVTMRKGDLGQSMFRATLGVLAVIEFYVAVMQFIFPPPKSPPAPAENPLRYVCHPFPASVCVRLSRLPQGLEELVLSSKCSLQTIDLLEHLSEWSSSIKDTVGDNGLASKALARLFAEPMDTSRSAIFILRHLRQAEAHTSIEFLLCLGIIIIIKHQRNIRKQDFLDDELLHSFTRSLKQYPNPSQPEIQLMIWLVAVISWRISHAFPAHADDLLDFTIQRHQQAQDLNSVRAIWRKFLWHQRFEGSWTRCWQPGLDRYEISKDSIRKRAQAAKCLGYDPPHNCLFTKGVRGLKMEDSNESSITNSSNLSRAPSSMPSHDSIASHDLEGE